MAPFARSASDAEVHLARRRLVADFDRVDGSPPRPPATPLGHLVNHRGITLERCFNSAVREIAHESPQAPFDRLSTARPSEAHPLDLTGDEHADPLSHAGWCVSSDTADSSNPYGRSA